MTLSRFSMELKHCAARLDMVSRKDLTRLSGMEDYLIITLVIIHNENFGRNKV